MTTLPVSKSAPGSQAVCYDQDLISRYGGRGPRYTSYPTALQFSDSFTADDYRRHAIASNDSGKSLSLYIHIPFCRSLCYYCACNKIVTRNAARVATYMRSLDQELSLQSALFGNERKVEQLHFGGGTPTYLGPEQLAELMIDLGDAFHLETDSTREFSIEVDPRSVDEEYIRTLAELGFNRLSLGIQDFDPQVQLAVNRVQTFDEVRRLVEAARRENFRSISFDLIYGLPFQSVASFDRTLSLVASLQPDRLAIYNYAHLPGRFKGQRMIQDSKLPASQVKLDILSLTIERLVGQGYEYVGMDHFARPGDELVEARRNGTLVRNFQGYSTRGNCDLVGLGVSAISSIGNAYSQNSPSTIEYEAMLGRNELPVKRGITIDEDDQLRASVIQQLMCYDELDFAAFRQSNDIDFGNYFAEELQRLDPLAQDGLVDVCDARIRVTPKGRLLLRSIAMVFDRYLAQQQFERYSLAI